jgi:hypothetical protein
MNREIPWPQVPEELSYEAFDLIDKYDTKNNSGSHCQLNVASCFVQTIFPVNLQVYVPNTLDLSATNVTSTNFIFMLGC